MSRTNYKKVLFNKKKLSSIDNSKHSFTLNAKIFANDNLTPMNESSGMVSLMVASREMALSESNVGNRPTLGKDRPVKIFNMDKLHGLFPDFDFWGCRWQE